MAPKNSIGYLSKMAENIKGQKATAAKPSATFSSAGLKGKNLQDSDSSSEDSSSSSGSDSDSDSEEKLAALKQKLGTKKTPGATSDKPAANGSNSKTKATLAASKPKEQASSSSSEASNSSSDSDSDSDSEEETAKPVQKKPATPAAKKSETATTTSSSGESDSSSGSESDSESESEADAKVTPATTPAAKPAATPKAVQKPAASSKPQQDAVSDSSDSEDDSEDDAVAVAKTNGASQTVDVSRPEWLNKSDFMLRKAASDNPGKEVADFLSKSNLEGKQVWYFTAPASLPISVIKDMEIDLAKAQSGGAILNHAGDAYGLDLEPYVTSSQIQLLIPSKGGEKYNSVNRPIDSTVHLRRIAEFGGASSVSSTATDDYVRKPKPIKQQPKNLKARFTPIGVPTRKPVPVASTQKAKPASDSDSDSSDVEMTNAPDLSKASEGNTKRKQPADDDSDTGSSESSDSDEEPEPPKSSKRAKKEAAPPSSQASKVSKSTPVPPPSLSSKTAAAAAAGTPSKVPDSSKSKKGKAKKVSQTPIPPPKLPGSGN